VDDEQRRWLARREYIRAHHPDHGGDPAAFIAGLAAIDQPPVPVSRGRVVVIPDRPWPARLLTALLHRIGWRRPSPRVK
jgi:hypothetical protein